MFNDSTKFNLKPIVKEDMSGTCANKTILTPNKVDLDDRINEVLGVRVYMYKIVFIYFFFFAISRR